MIRKGYLIMGPESSGTRMMKESLSRAGAWVKYDPEHSTRLSFKDKPEILAFRRSIPHATVWPDLEYIKRRMEYAGYSVLGIKLDRKTKYMALSQLRNNHVTSLQMALNHIDKAREVLRAYSGPAVSVHYEQFVESEDYRRQFFELINLAYPITMHWYNANEKYDLTEANFPES